MTFREVIEEISKIHEVGCDILKCFQQGSGYGGKYPQEIHTFEELEAFYNSDRKTFMKIFFYNCICTEQFLEAFLSNDRSFLVNYSEPVIDYVTYWIERATLPHYEIQADSYFKWPDRKFSFGDFTIEDVLSFSRLLNHPPPPLRRNFFDEENARDKTYAMERIYGENMYKNNRATVRLHGLILEGKERGDFRLYTEPKPKNEVANNEEVESELSGEPVGTGVEEIGDVLEMYLHSWILVEYPLFERIINSPLTKELSMRLDIGPPAFRVLVAFLYGVNPDFSKMTRDDIIELAEVCDYIHIPTLSQLCFMAFDDSDLEFEYQLGKKLANMRLWFKQLRDQLITSEKVLDSEILDPVALNKLLDPFKDRMERYFRNRNAKGVLKVAFEIKRMFVTPRNRRLMSNTFPKRNTDLLKTIEDRYFFRWGNDAEADEVSDEEPDWDGETENDD